MGGRGLRRIEGGAVRAAYHRIGREPYLCGLCLPPPPRTPAACGEGEEGVAFDVSQGLHPVLGCVALPGLNLLIPFV